jgi:cell division protein FtsW (lipid II flippase)
MAVTRSRAAERVTAARRGAWRRGEALWLLAGSLVLVFGLVLVYKAKTRSFAQIESGLAGKQLLDLNALGAREELLPFLSLFTQPAERSFVARRIYDASGDLPNVGALARLRVTGAEIQRTRGLKAFRDRHALTLLTGEQFRQLKPLFVVRRPAQFRRAFLIWTAIFFAAFWAVHLWWSVRRFQGDGALLPALLPLAGAGLILMISLRDPVRDSLIFVDFAQGAAGGCVLLAVASALDYERLFGKLSFVPLVGSFLLSVLLIAFGYGPGTSDAKVNLFGFQPVELIRILLILFLAGYFAGRWDILRHAREQRPALARFARLGVPPLEYTLPVFACVGLSLLFFFLQKDMGPALVFACLFLVLYSIARKGTLMAAAGLALLFAGFTAGHILGFPRTVHDRVSMWASPWDNLVHGGDQLAQSLWAYATGGLFGTGPGLGDPALVPAAHTDLVLSALGEEWGFLGLLAVFALYGFILCRSARIALRARGDYEFFLAAGLTAAMALQILLIAAGSLGVLPLTGVVTPFLSYGRTSMLANFLVFAMLLSISSRPGDAERNAPFRAPVQAAGLVLGVLAAAVVAKAAYVQVLRSGPIMGEGTLVVQADGARRYQYNPRFQEIVRDIPKGTIYDRNGIPLATSNWDELEKHRAQYQQLGVNIDQACARTESRHYPFGGLTFDLLGDLRTRIRWGASNTSFVERDSATRLRGYDDRPTLVDVKNPKTGKMERVVRYDLRELVPLLRHRYEPDNPAVRRVLDRARDVRMSVDARLQVRAAEILKNALRQAGTDKGALVVLDPSNGDLLASVSYPLPPAGPGDTTAAQTPGDTANPYLDRARYGLYPPGSTFKVVTAMAALRTNPQFAKQTYACIRLPDGRVGNYIRGSSRPIRDDIQDAAPHGTIDMERAVIVSCNAYFAQLGTYNVGAQALFDTGSLLGISMAAPDTPEQLRKSLPQSSYGQGQVVASPFQMARVAATVANGGLMPAGRWIVDESNDRTQAPQAVISPDVAATLGRFMREVVTQGTGRRAADAPVPVAGKTGTAELASDPSHAWFIGFAPYGGARRIAFAVLIENGRYGGTYAAPAGAAVVAAARSLGLIGAAKQP